MYKHFFPQRFNHAATAVKELAAQPEDEHLLELYALYKQAIVGDCNTGLSSQNFGIKFIIYRACSHMYNLSIMSFNFLFLERPGMLDFKGKAKWDAWNNKKSLGQETAKEHYIAKVESLIASIGKK